MKGYYEKEIILAPSRCDASSRLSLHSIFVLFQDSASEHAETLGIGGDRMTEKGLFWLTVRTRIKVHTRPHMMQRLQLKTWLGAFEPGDLRTFRYYTLHCGETLVAEGKTEWTVFRLEDQAVVRIREAGMPDVEILPDVVCPEPFSRFRPVFDEADPAAEHVVRPSDVDMGQHMNNTAYVRAILDTFTVEELKNMDAKELEIAFRQPCFGGETLTIRRKETENGWQFAVLRPDGKPAALAQLRVL